MEEWQSPCDEVPDKYPTNDTYSGRASKPHAQKEKLKTSDYSADFESTIRTIAHSDFNTLLFTPASAQGLL